MHLPRHARGWLALAVLAAGCVAGPAGAARTPAPLAGAAGGNLVNTGCRLVAGPRVHRDSSPADAPPVGNSACPGIRPGAEYVTAVGSCTLAFVFSGSDSGTYLATAGHCADLAEHAPRTYPRGKGPIAADAVTGKEFGRFVYSGHTSGATDFGLIRLSPGARAEAQVCHFGGPTGMSTSVDRDVTLAQHYGNGLGMESTRARTAAVPHGLYRADWVPMFGAATPGDSGGPVLVDGLALGTIDEIRGNGNGPMVVTRLPDAIAAAAKALRVRLTLRTAETL